MLRIDPRRRPNPGPDLEPAEIERLFDAFVLVQAQDSLALTDEQFAPFVASLRRLQEARRERQARRQRLLRSLQRLVSTAETSERQIESGLQAHQDHDIDTAEILHSAYASLDGVLDLRQRARFRLFEQRMERRKLDLATRARRGGTRTLPSRQRQGR